MISDKNSFTIKNISLRFKNSQISSVDLTKSYLEKIKKDNPKINAFITVLTNEALAMAQASDKRRKKGQVLSLLDGCPIAIKDNMAMKETLTTAGSRILENFISPYDATVIEKLKAVGAVILGKTNMDEFAMGSSTETSYFGSTRNPHDPARVPGGSSGGSAAAVAADMCLAALGSDTGGSIRQPASFCGVVGFKPTYGAVSRYGLFAMASSLDQIGPIAKTAEDAEILFEAISGQDLKDSTSINLENIKTKKEIKDQIKNIKFGLPQEYFAQGLDPKVKKVIDKAIEKIKNLGGQIRKISLPNTKYALACYYIIMPVEVSSNLARFDGIKYGLSAQAQSSKLKAESLLDVYLQSRSDGFGKEAKRRIMLGAYASSAGYIDQYYNQAQKVRALIKKDFDEAFKEVDFILGPVSPETAFKLDEKTADPLKMYLSDIYTIAVNLAGLPAISLPCGQVDSLPIGLQIIGPQFSDRGILNLAKIYQRKINGL